MFDSYNEWLDELLMLLNVSFSHEQMLTHAHNRIREGDNLGPTIEVCHRCSFIDQHSQFDLP